MKEDKKYSTYAYENGEKNQSRTLFMFANRYVRIPSVVYTFNPFGIKCKHYDNT